MNQFDKIAHIIQLSVAPVFLLTGVATLLNVLSGRLARIIDRARVLEKELDTPEPRHETAIVNELCILEKRGKLIYHAVKLSTSSALLVCLVIAALFASSMLRYSTQMVVSGLFIAAMLTSTVSLALFSVGRFTSQLRPSRSDCHPAHSSSRLMVSVVQHRAREVDNRRLRFVSRRPELRSSLAPF